MTFQSHSQAGQDLFTYHMTEGKQAGSFLDIGCHDAKFHSNTYGLEEYCGWRGLLVDVVSGCESRKSTFVKCDATNPSDELKLQYSLLPHVVDFLSLDTDEALIGTFLEIPWDKTTFRVVCVEHDSYRIGTKVRNQLRRIMDAMGYDLVCADVCVKYPETEPPRPFEDWYCYVPLVNPDLVKQVQCEGQFWKNILLQ